MNWIRNRVIELWRRSMMHRALLVAPPVALLLLMGFWKFGTGGSATYYKATVEEGNVIQVVQATGTINAVTTVQVGSQVSGRIAEIFVDFNSPVKKDQIIAKIDPSILQTRLMQAEADLESAQANVKGIEAQIETQRADVMAAKAGVDRAQAQFRETELNLKRTGELFEQGIVSASQRDTVQTTYDSAAANLRVTEAQHEQAKARLKQTQAQLEQAKAGVAQRRAAYESARVDLGHTIIKAPIDGIVIARNVDVGQTVAASLQAPILFMIAQDLTEMLVYAKTDEANVGNIKVGAMASFRVDSFPREMFRGRVTQVRMNATTVQNVVTYDTIIEFENRDQKLFPGMTAYVTIPVAWANNVVKIPNGALRFHQQIPEDERKELLAKYNVEDPSARERGLAGATRRTSGAGQGGGNTQGPASSPGGAGSPAASGNQSGEGQQRQRRMGGDFAAMMGMGGGSREQWGIVYKLLPNGRDIQPVRLKLGVTDFAFTELKEGEIKAGDVLVIGRSSGARAANTTTAPGLGGRSPMGPGGIPRR